MIQVIEQTKTILELNILLVKKISFQSFKGQVDGIVGKNVRSPEVIVDKYRHK